jgi:type IV pilus assembly protein PilC
MAMHYENENKVNNKVKSAMVYPVVLMILSISVVAFLMIFIMPVFINMFESMGTKLPVPTLILMGISKVLTSYWYIIVLILGIVGYGIKKAMSTPSGKYALDGVKLSIPVLKNLNEKVIVARFTRTLSTILTSGISLVSGLEAVEKVIGNKVVERKLSMAREQILKGINLSEALEETKAFPPMLNSMIRIGEESGKLDEILDRTANFYDEELDTSIKQFTTIIEPIMIVIMGGIIAFIVLAMMMPMFNMYSAL